MNSESSKVARVSSWSKLANVGFASVALRTGQRRKSEIKEGDDDAAQPRRGAPREPPSEMAQRLEALLRDVKEMSSGEFLRPQTVPVPSPPKSGAPATARGKLRGLSPTEAIRPDHPLLTAPRSGTSTFPASTRVFDGASSAVTLSGRYCARTSGSGMHRMVRDRVLQLKRELLDEVATKGLTDGLISKRGRRGVSLPPAVSPRPAMHITKRDPAEIMRERLAIEKLRKQRLRALAGRHRGVTTWTGANSQHCAKIFLTWIRLMQASRVFASVVVQKWDPFDDEVRRGAFFHPPRGVGGLRTLERAAAVINRAVFKHHLRRRVHKKCAAIALIAQWFRALCRQYKLKFAIHHYLSRVRRIQRNWRCRFVSSKMRPTLWTLQYMTLERRVLRAVHLASDRDVLRAQKTTGATAASGELSPATPHSPSRGFLSSMVRNKVRELRGLEADFTTGENMVQLKQLYGERRATDQTKVFAQMERVSRQLQSQSVANLKMRLQWRRSEAERRRESVWLTDLQEVIGGVKLPANEQPEPPPFVSVPRLLDRSQLLQLCLQFQRDDAAAQKRLASDRESVLLVDSRRSSLSKASPRAATLRRKSSPPKKLPAVAA